MTCDKVHVKYVDSVIAGDGKRISCVQYTLTHAKNQEWSEDVARLPPVEQADISDYLVHRTSYDTSRKFKAEKALGAHNQLTSGWVKNIFTHKPQGCENTTIIAQRSVSL